MIGFHEIYIGIRKRYDTFPEFFTCQCQIRKIKVLSFACTMFSRIFVSICGKSSRISFTAWILYLFWVRWNGIPFLCCWIHVKNITISVSTPLSEEREMYDEIVENLSVMYNNRYVQSIYCASQRKPSPYPCRFKTEHINSSSGRPGISLRATLPWKQKIIA